jgi:hypothetical protein
LRPGGLPTALGSNNLLLLPLLLLLRLPIIRILRRIIWQMLLQANRVPILPTSWSNLLAVLLVSPWCGAVCCYMEQGGLICSLLLYAQTRWNLLPIGKVGSVVAKCFVL